MSFYCVLYIVRCIALIKTGQEDECKMRIYATILPPRMELQQFRVHIEAYRRRMSGAVDQKIRDLSDRHTETPIPFPNCCVTDEERERRTVTTIYRQLLPIFNREMKIIINR